MFVHVFSETGPASSPALLRIGATWGQEFCLNVSFRPVGCVKDLSTQASPVRGRAKSMELPPQNDSEGIKPNKLIYETCLAACGRVLSTALTSYSISSQSTQKVWAQFSIIGQELI